MSNKTPRKVWVLTREHNAYDQYGEYFVAVFESKPNHQQLMGVVGINAKGLISWNNDIMAALAFIEHLLSGGGRQNTEDVWYNLEEVTCNT